MHRSSALGSEYDLPDLTAQFKTLVTVFKDSKPWNLNSGGKKNPIISYCYSCWILWKPPWSLILLSWLLCSLFYLYQRTCNSLSPLLWSLSAATIHCSSLCAFFFFPSLLTWIFFLLWNFGLIYSTKCLYPLNWW